MWIAVEDAFVSIVRDPVRAGLMIVRGRKSEHIRALFPGTIVDLLPECDIEDFDHENDYLFRASIPQTKVIEVITQRIEAVDTTSFRNRIADPIYYDALCRAREDIHAIEPGSPYAYLNASEYNERD